MKTLTNLYHHLVLYVCVLAVAVGFVFYFQPLGSVAIEALPEGQITGWGWSDNYGWISLNCFNVYAGENYGNPISHCDGDTWTDPISGDLMDVGADYGVRINPDGTMGGSAWNKNAGYISFSSNEPGINVVGDFPVHEDLSPYPYENFVTIDTETKILSGWAVATYGDNIASNNAWIQFRAGDDCYLFEAVYVNENNYCVELNGDNFLQGWAWSGGNYGIGWIIFQRDFSGGPYLATRYSDIYSGGTVTGPRAPEGEYNATYCILTGEEFDIDDEVTGGNITLSSSKACLIGDVDIEFPDPAESFVTSIVDINLDNLLSQSKQDVEFHYISGDTHDVWGDLNSGGRLGDKVYYFTGNHSEDPGDDHDVTFYLDSNALMSDNGSLASGTIVIDGDLYINKNITYGISSAATINEIASVAWIVLGDVYVAPSVTEVVGTFIVLGNDAGGSGGFYTGEYDYIDAGGGVWAYETPPEQLSFSGVIVAKEIFLQRAYFEGLAPAEIFKYDGRVLLNTPPGLANFAGKLPSWSR